MAVTCPGCGREYDVTLFQFGRTIHCTCGVRVGRDERLVLPAKEGPPRFVADAMLGDLARWLRILGYDTAFEAEIADGELVRRAADEERWILTRDRRLPEEWRVEGCLVLEREEALEQVEEVRGRLELGPPPGLFSRCTVCNGVLEEVDAGAVEGEVPARVLDAHEGFNRCPECGKVYWSGSHARRIRDHLDELLA